jgi:major membrane immunogen (membrane-anchored lipoprotein)
MLFWALVKATPLKNTTYKGIKYPADSRGYKPTMQVTVEKGKITKIEYAEVKEADGKAKEKGVYKYDAYFDAIETLPKKIVEAGGIPTEVDGFAGATQTSTKFFELYKAYMAAIYKVSK